MSDYKWGIMKVLSLDRCIRCWDDFSFPVWLLDVAQCWLLDNNFFPCFGVTLGVIHSGVLNIKWLPNY